MLSYGTWVSRFHAIRRSSGPKFFSIASPTSWSASCRADFEFPLYAGQLNRTELWVPMSFQAGELAPAAAANWSYEMVGRLKPGVSPKQAQTDAETVAQEIMRNYPAMMANLHISALVRPLQQETMQKRGPCCAHCSSRSPSCFSLPVSTSPA